jgi:hypothetical protein
MNEHNTVRVFLCLRFHKTIKIWLVVIKPFIKYAVYVKLRHWIILLIIKLANHIRWIILCLFNKIMFQIQPSFVLPFVNLKCHSTWVIWVSWQFFFAFCTVVTYITFRFSYTELMTEIGLKILEMMRISHSQTFIGLRLVKLLEHIIHSFYVQLWVIKIF